MTCSSGTIFLSTPSARRATDRLVVRPLFSSISIHALREEGDASSPPSVPFLCVFLSTPSARRATRFLCQVVVCKAISIHALREEGDLNGGKHFAFAIISIHALREEGDDAPRHYPSTTYQFLSTPSARRATFRLRKYNTSITISIHALREEGDAGKVKVTL